MLKIPDELQKPVNVLVFPAGAENRMDIYESLRYNGHFNVYGASSKRDHGKAVYPSDHYFIGELNISDENFIENFNALIKLFEIDYVIPTHDTVAVHLTKMSDFIRAGIVCSPYETARIAENKSLTAEALKETGYYPRVYGSIDEIKEYPVFLKPWIGAGSKGTFLVRDRGELMRILEKNSQVLISEYLPGREYTVSCFTNKEGALIFAGANTRERILNGRSYYSERAEEREDFHRIAEDLNRRLTFRGSWFFQVKEDEKGCLKLLEFSVRQIGEMVLYRQLGVNFAALALYDALGYDVEILFNEYELMVDLRFTNNYMLNYEYDRIYLDFEAIMGKDKKINPRMMKFIYQAVDEGKKITLFSSRKGDAGGWLDAYFIHKGLFDRTIDILSENQMLYYITEAKAVFISGNHRHRQQVKKVCRIPVFDVDAVDCLANSAGA